ncbi:MAG: DUF5752 family protein [Elusimicrobiota bacterium]
MQSFQFYTRLYLTELLGLKTRNLKELLEGIKTVPGSSIYHHTHRFLQQHHFLSPEPPNDFAYWITNILQESYMGEKFASVNIIQFESIRQLREKFISLLEEYILTIRETRNAPEGQEFYFMKSKSFVVPTVYTAHTLKEFHGILEKISINSLYFHIFESRLRLEKGTNDFSMWFTSSLNEKELADRIAKLDPYTQTLDSLRKKICKLIEHRLNDKNN